MIYELPRQSKNIKYYVKRYLFYFQTCSHTIKTSEKAKIMSALLKKDIYGKICKLAPNPKVLLSRNLMVEFMKEQDYQEVNSNLKTGIRNLGLL